MSLEDHIKANTEAVLALNASTKAATEAILALLAAFKTLPASSAGANTPKSEKADPVADFIATLSGINWKWEDLDDPAAFKAGKATVAAAKEAATKLGKKALAAFDAAQKAGLAGVPAAVAGNDSSTSSAESETAGTDVSGGAVIALSDLQVFTGMIQAFKTKDAENGPKAIGELKDLVASFGATRLSEPKIKDNPSLFPAIKEKLEAIVAKYKIPALAA